MLELYIFAVVIVVFLALGLNVVISQNPVYSILYLVLFFITGSSLLALFGFDYLALIFVLVYVGAIAVLFLFVIMILDIKVINQVGFDATFLIVLSLALFIFPLVYQISFNLIQVQNFFSDIFSWLPVIGFLSEYKIGSLYYLNTASIVTYDKECYFLLEALVLDLLKYFELLLLDTELSILYIQGFFDSFILLKMSFCEFGFVAPEPVGLILDYNPIYKVDYDSSVKNFQILYTDFTALFIISGGILLVAMTSCISLALPSRQQAGVRVANHKFKSC
uniref:NADH-ubiquinone oxidoreductase chain 6 n=1 Tax=Dictyopteris divaricata TaxID=156996 RepID=A0A4Y5T7T4_9PHAE|nr:NADH dehydrogenase subunit 6 [Dictyopteris divaricata]QDB64143.1 NADH dehydrogenase subunit 6 [Dictyopteris divaricata]